MTGLSCGVDVGGTKILAAVVDGQGSIVDQHRVPSPADDVAQINDSIAAAVGNLRERHDIDAVGVGAAGYVGADRNTVMFAPNIAWRDLPLGDELAGRIGLPVIVENDANAAAWGEFAFGAGRDVDNLLMVTVGTGVGGGIISDSRLFRGGFGAGAEIGHLRVVPDGALCPCGNRGCLESYASGTALVRETRRLADQPAAADLLARADGDAESIDGRMITSAAQEGDGFARERLADVGRWLGEALASLAAVLDPAVIAIGGGVAEAGDLLIDPVREAYLTQLSGRGLRPEAEIRQASLGNDAGVIGAADLARLG